MIVFIIFLAVIIIIKIFSKHSDSKTIDTHEHYYNYKIDYSNQDIKKLRNMKIKNESINDDEFEKVFSSFDTIFNKK